MDYSIYRLIEVLIQENGGKVDYIEECGGISLKNLIFGQIPFYHLVSISEKVVSIY